MKEKKNVLRYPPFNYTVCFQCGDGGRWCKLLVGLARIARFKFCLNVYVHSSVLLSIAQCALVDLNSQWASTLIKPVICYPLSQLRLTRKSERKIGERK